MGNRNLETVAGHGKTFHLVRSLPQVGENGEIRQWFGTCTDIDDQKQADANMRRQWHTFDTALSNTPDFICTFDLAGRFTYANRPLLALWQKSLEEVCGKNFFDIGLPADRAESLQSQIQQVIATKQPARSQAFWTQPGGETACYDRIFSPVLNANGRVEVVTCSIRDITEQNRAREAAEA